MIQLQTTTNHCFLKSSSHPEETMERAADLGYDVVAVTDEHSLAGLPKAFVAAEKHGIRLICGAKIIPADGPAILLWAKTKKGYGNLSKLLTTGCMRAEKGECHLFLDDLDQFSQDLVAGLIPQGKTPNEILEVLPKLKTLFNQDLYLVASFNSGLNDLRLANRYRQLAARCEIPIVIAPDVRYHSQEKKVLLDAMTAIRLGCSVQHVTQFGITEHGQTIGANSTAHLRSKLEWKSLQRLLPEAMDSIREIEKKCSFGLGELRYQYPTEIAPEGVRPMDYLRQLTWEGGEKRFPDGISEKVRDLLNKELDLIEELQYEAYFLTVYDIVKFANENGILCQGRGSAANSATCYCLGVTNVDPEESNLLFARFVSKERNEPPDIDVDFEHFRREEVLQFVYNKYGRMKAGMTAVNICYCLRSAIRDAGKAIGVAVDKIDALAKSVDGYHRDSNLAARIEAVGMNPNSNAAIQLIDITNQLIGHPRHRSQHPGGMVLSQMPLQELVPIENAAMPDRSVIQWDKYDLDELGILKVDCLGLGILTALQKSFDLLKEHYNEKKDLASIPADDKPTYEMICKADTVGVFQIESRAQMATLPRLKPECFYDLVIEIALVRPGPIQGNMVHPLLRRRAKIEETTFPSPAVEEILGKTYGIPIFQEQVMRMAIELAGFKDGEADQLRKSMGAWRRNGSMEAFKQRLIDGMLEKGLSREFGELIYSQISGFGEYGFPESHSTSFAVLCYATSWLKCHYPGVYLAALLNSLPMGFYGPAQLIRDAKDHGVVVKPVDVCYSDWNTTLEDDKSVRLGFRLLKGLPEETADQISQCRAESPFRSYDDFRIRTGIGNSDLKTIADADCFLSFGLSRRQAAWQAMPEIIDCRKQPLLAGQEDDDWDVKLPELTAPEEVLLDYAEVGLSLKGHPMGFYRQHLKSMNVVSCKQLKTIKNGKWISLAGIVLMRQRPGTAKGVTFVTLEDETGQANLIVKADIWKKFYKICRCHPCWLVHGRVQSQDGVIHILPKKIEDFLEPLQGQKMRSRDFR